MTNPERGRRTGQHEQPTQQAAFLGCTEAAIRMYADLPVARLVLDENSGGKSRGFLDAAHIMDCVRVAFEHAERIEITRFRNIAIWQDAAALAEARAYGEEIEWRGDEERER